MKASNFFHVLFEIKIHETRGYNLKTKQCLLFIYCIFHTKKEGKANRYFSNKPNNLNHDFKIEKLEFDYV